jgi:hypothetical protein
MTITEAIPIRLAQEWNQEPIADSDGRTVVASWQGPAWADVISTDGGGAVDYTTEILDRCWIRTIMLIAHDEATRTSSLVALPVEFVTFWVESHEEFTLAEARDVAAGRPVDDVDDAEIPDAVRRAFGHLLAIYDAAVAS